MKKAIQNVTRIFALILTVSCLSQNSLGYSVLTHEAIIDSCWKESIQPMLVKRFPRATPEQLREAYAHAYGGAIIQDMGYYPFGSKFFSDLTHYARSGDFIEALLAEAQDINEYAFALGALAHYAADNSGHPIAVNRTVPILYPKLRARYGANVTYDEDPAAHIKTEFGFDVVQIAQRRYASQAYHDFIGFKASKAVLERAFLRTYGIELKDIFANLDLALGTYRRAISTVIPQMTRVAWETKKEEIQKTTPGITREKFVYQISRTEFEKEWGKQYDKPRFFDKTLALFMRVIPKVGPFAPLSFKLPTPEAERMFSESLNTTLTGYRSLLGRVATGKLDLQNKDFDTGEPTRAGEYAPADVTYGKLLERLADKDFENITPSLRQNILGFYSDLSGPNATKKEKNDWQATLRALDKLKAKSTQANRPEQRR